MKTKVVLYLSVIGLIATTACKKLPFRPKCCCEKQQGQPPPPHHHDSTIVGE